ncbi:ATPase [Salinirubrum litoreum]|uniref:ATPase n=1 Tax=Salinirubrum litoreum TaxID=1126234 RepID=A0ABD5R953_9EURY|nr:ATPase [Salinirubrum litoreum]
MRLLVAGGDRVDAGKTTFSVGLLAHLAEVDHAPVGFKPRAGNDYWFDHDDVQAATGDGRLYGKDATRLAAASAGDVRPEAINPVHRLWRPTPGRQGLLGESDRTFLVDRVTGGGSETDLDTQFVVNGEAESDGDLPDLVKNTLPLADATRVSSIPEFNDLMADRYLPAFERVADRIRATDTAVVESYSDIALPLDDVGFDAVAVVEPTRCRVYAADRYLKACEVARGSARDGQLEERVGAVVEMLDPLARVELPALSGEAQNDPASVAEANREAYHALLDAV